MILEPEANNVPHAFVIFVELKHENWCDICPNLSFTSIKVESSFLESLGLNGV